MQVNAYGAKIPYCTWITIEVEFWLTDWTTLRISDVVWTIKAIPSSGWILDDQVFDLPSGKWFHKFNITNDDKTDSFIVSGLTFNANRDWHDNLTDVSLQSPPYPDFVLKPGESWQTDISTPEPLYGGHIYFKYNITDLNGGSDPVNNWADHPIVPVKKDVDVSAATSSGFAAGILTLLGLE